jgi:hypothetical protein
MQERAVKTIYDEIGKHLNLTEPEVRQLATERTLVHEYYMWKFDWDPNDASTIPF